MIKYRSRWKDRDMKMLEGTNKLYEIVKYYGGYLYYCAEVSDGAYDAYYFHNNERMKDIFINAANADVKSYLHTEGISGRKMRRMLITGKRKRVMSYGWISRYVGYILDKCMENDVLKNQVIHILQDDCGYCRAQMDVKEWRMLCAKRLLGFQYSLLKDVSERRIKISESAKLNIDTVENLESLNEVIERCPIVMENKKRA